MTANQIAQKTDISLQLVKYHLNKLQDLGVVKISKIEKNSKSQDMKVYSATKFSIVIVPPKLSEKTKESKLLVRSFRHIYKVAGLAIATGVSGLLSLSQLQEKSIPVDSSKQFAATEDMSKRLESGDESVASVHVGEPESIASAPVAESQSQDFAPRSLEITEDVIDSGVTQIDLFIPFVVITVILGGLTAYYLWKFKKSS